MGHSTTLPVPDADRPVVLVAAAAPWRLVAALEERGYEAVPVTTGLQLAFFLQIKRPQAVIAASSFLPAPGLEVSTVVHTFPGGRDAAIFTVEEAGPDGEAICADLAANLPCHRLIERLEALLPGWDRREPTPDSGFLPIGAA